MSRNRNRAIGGYLRGQGGVAWAAAALLLLACQGDAVHDRSAALTFPTSWNAIPQAGVGIGDIKGDGSNNGREVVGNADFPAVYTATDGANLFIRLRLDDDPEKMNGDLAEFAWGLLFDTDGDLSAYEYSLILDASGGSDAIVFGENTVKGTTGDPADVADVVVETILIDRVPPDHNVENGPADTCFGQVAPGDPTCTTEVDRDHFIDFAVPLSVLSSDPQLTGAGVDLSTPVKIIAGVSSSGQSLSLDLAGGDDDTNPTLTDVASDDVYIDGSSADNDRDGVLNPDDLDDDNDGILDTDENRFGVDPDADNDGDGVPNWRDVDDRGDGNASGCTDTAGDGVCDDFPGEVDSDGDGVPNQTDLDSDNDGIPDVTEAGHGVADSDSDGMLDGDVGTNGYDDAVETSPDSGVAGYGLLDTDGDGAPDFLDLDSDDDGEDDVDESGSGALDVDNDGRIDPGADPDRDGLLDVVDAMPNTYGFPSVVVTGFDTDGDGIPDPYDVDDDGSGVPGDSDGDGLTDDVECATGWPCRDGDGDGQPDYMEPTECGNSALNPGEGCDDGDQMGGDGCSAVCLVEDGFACNATAPGATGDLSCASGLCDTTGGGAGQCEPANTCGNGRLEAGEGCDDGGTATGDGCDANCDVEDGTACNDDSAGDTGDASCASGVCDTTGGGVGLCEPANTCGNGRLEAGEGCDDGGTATGDGCDANCDVEDGTACNDDSAGDTGDASCASGVCDTAGGAPGVCVASGCGNGVLEANEGCDDGGMATGDGCDDACKVETGTACNDDTAGQTGDASCASGMCDTGGGAPGVCVAQPTTDTDGDGVIDAEDLDDDNDGIPDSVEGSGDADGDGVPNDRDLDSDGDGLADVVEAGHGAADADSDGTVDCSGGVGANGLCDALETSADSGSANYTPVDTDGDGHDDYLDLDADDDGIADLVEGDAGCDDTDDNGVCDGPDGDGDGIADSVDGASGFGDDGYPTPPDTDSDDAPDYQDLDSDGDTVFDIDESGHSGLDGDDDGMVDGDADVDGDGINDAVDDSDGDGTPDASDGDAGSHGGLADPAIDTDGDGTPDFRDPDADGDGIGDGDEVGDDPANPPDTDGDGNPDFQDPDSDNDGVGDATDNCRVDGNADQTDTDSDGAGQACDSDDNGDGFDDALGLQGGGCAATGGSGGGAMALLLALFALRLGGRRRRQLAVLAAVVGLGGGGRAMAQQVESEYPVERFRLATDREGVLDVEWGGVMPHLEVEGALWLGYADDPLNVYMQDAAGDRDRVGSLVSHRLGGNLTGAIGVVDRIQLGLSVPLVLSQTQDLSGVMAAAGSLSSFGLGDVRLIPKLQVLRQGDFPVNAAVILGFELPTSSSSDFFGEAGPVLQPEVAVSRTFGGGLRGAVNLGYRIREQSTALDLTVDDELFTHLGVGYRFADSGGPPAEVDLTLALATAADDFLGAFNRNYAEVKLGGAYDVVSDVQLLAGAGVGVAEGFGTPDWRILVGARYRRSFEPAQVFEAVVAHQEPRDSDGDGLNDDVDRCPNEPETVNQIDDGDGCPDEIPDTDGDGLNDQVDACPNEPEDKDTFEDDNGCPDPDNDGDGIADVSDRCPLEAGVPEVNGCPDPDRDSDTVVDRLDNCPDEAGKPEFQGCPQRQLVQIQGGKLEILDVVYFRTNKAIILRKSYKLLDNVAQVIKAHPEIAVVRVEGHTDDRGKDEYNKTLSQQRAEAVVAYLVSKGVDEKRLDAVGFGEEKPIEDNKTKKGRAANRRVEFVIVGDTDTEIDSKRSGPTDDSID